MRGAWRLLLAVLLAGMSLTSCEDILNNMDGGDPRDKLVDTWKVDESLLPYKSAMEIYWVEISKHPYDSTRVIIYNFFNVDADAEAVVSGSNLSLPAQTLQGGFGVSGSGQVQGIKADEIVWTYTVDDGSGQPDQYTAVYSRLTF